MKSCKQCLTTSVEWTLLYLYHKILNSFSSSVYKLYSKRDENPAVWGATINITCKKELRYAASSPVYALPQQLEYTESLQNMNTSYTKTHISDPSGVSTLE